MRPPIHEPVHHPPRYLFFVQHASSRARMTDSGGFDAADTWTPPHDPWQLQQLIMNHVDWACRAPSCFISAFGSFEHAYNWGIQRGRPVTIHQIDTRNLHPGVLIFSAVDFTPNCFEHEYLFLHGIPGFAIVQAHNLPDPNPTMCPQSAGIKTIINTTRNATVVRSITALQTMRDGM